MTSFIQEYKAEFRTPVPFVIWVALTMVMALSGPFGSYEATSFPTRLLFWAGMVAVAVCLGIAVRSYVRAVLGLRDFRRGAILTAGIVCVLLALPLHWVVTWLFHSISPGFPNLVEISVFIFSICLGVEAFTYSRSGAFDFAPAGGTPSVPPPIPAVRLMQRLSPETRGALVLISVRDHYVDVRTTAGQASLLMRFSDAIAEADGVDGEQVHRSYWVAWDAVTGVERADGKVFLTLCHGSRVPVSRNHRAKLESRGLL